MSTQRLFLEQLFVPTVGRDRWFHVPSAGGWQVAECAYFQHHGALAHAKRRTLTFMRQRGPPAVSILSLVKDSNHSQALEYQPLSSPRVGLST